MHKGTLGKAVVFTVGGILLALSATAAQAAITRLVGPDTPIPNGQPGDTFLFLGDAVLDGDTFAFRGGATTSDLPVGVYRGSLSSGGLSVVFDSSTNSPASGYPLVNAFSVEASGDAVAAWGIAPVPGGGSSTYGIFTQSTTGGGLSTAAESGGPVRPSSRFAFEQGVAIFEGASNSDPSLSGIYSVPAAGGALTTLVDTNTAVPGQPGKVFTDFNFKAGGFDDGVVAFQGEYDGGEGIYTVIPGQAPVRIVDSQTAFPTTNHGNQIPDDSTIFNAPSIDNGDLVFSARFGHSGPFDGNGLYLYRNGTVTLIADSDTPLPNDPANTFDSLGSIVYPANAAHYIIDNGRILFDTFDGIYQFDQGNLIPVVLPMDQVDGDSLFQWGLSHTSLSGDNLIFYGFTLDPGFQSGSYGVFLATIASGLAGDLNADGFVGIADLNIVLGAWNQNVPPGEWLEGDPSGDGFVGIADLNVVLGNWNAGVPPGVPGGDANIPEPGVLSLIGVAGLWMAGGKSHRSRR